MKENKEIEAVVSNVDNNGTKTFEIKEEKIYKRKDLITTAIIAFLIGAILSILLLITKIKKMDEYIPFGPFIVLATFLVMFVPYSIITTILLKIFTLGLYK